MTPRILIVDDACFIREILKTIVQKQGWIVAGEACDGDEAIQKTFATKPDLVILDIVMPKFSGLEVASQIFKKYPDMPIVGISTMDNEEVSLKAIEMGFASFITKPFANWSMISAIKEALEVRLRKSG